MSEINDGGPAFPNKGDMGRYDGMSLRDWFAGQALNGLLSRAAYMRTVRVNRHSAVVHAYRLADAMLAERAKRKEGGA